MSEAVTVADARQSGVFWLGNDVIDKYGRELGPFGIAAYCALVRHADKGGRCFPSLATLANETGMSKPTLVKALETLERVGLVTRERRDAEGKGHISTLYTLVNVADKPCKPHLQALVSHVDTKEYPQEGLTTKTPAIAGGGDTPQAGNPSEMAAKVEAVTGRTFEPDKQTAAIIDGLRGAVPAAGDREETSRARRKPSAPPHPETQATVLAFQAILGYDVPSWPREAKAAKWMLEHGYTQAEILDCARSSLSDKWWQGKPLSLETVRNRIGAWKRAAVEGMVQHV